VSRRRPPSRQHKCQPQTRHPGDFRGCFGGYDSGQWYSLDFMGLQWENTVVLLTPAEGGTTLVGHKVCDPMLLPANQTMSFHHYPTGRDTTAVYPTVPQTFPNDVSRKDSKDGKYE
jgi:hypothetical protein